MYLRWREFSFRDHIPGEGALDLRRSHTGWLTISLHAILEDFASMSDPRRGRFSAELRPVYPEEVGRNLLQMLQFHW